MENSSLYSRMTNLLGHLNLCQAESLHSFRRGVCSAAESMGR